MTSVVWHVHSNGRSHAFRRYEGEAPPFVSKLSVCGSVRLTVAPKPADLVYPCCNCLRIAGDPRPKRRRR